MSAVAIAAVRSNRFESFEQFKSSIRKAFIEDSGIAEESFDACVEFHEDQEFEYGNEVKTPIHDELDWRFKRFGHQPIEPMYAAFLKNEDGSVWQAIISRWDEEKQRPYQYIAPKGIGDRAFLPPIPPEIRKRIDDRYGIEVPSTGSFWEWVRDINIPRILTEGGKKGLCGLSLGYLTIALYGCSCGAKGKNEFERVVDPYLISDLEQFATPGSQWLLCFDRDEKKKAQLSVAAGKKKLRQALSGSECFVADIIWKSEQGKGLDDFVVSNGSGAFDPAYHKAIASLEKAFRSNSGNEVQPAGSKKKQHLNLLDSRWGNKLRFNEMTLTVELDDKPLNLDTLSVQLASEFDIDISKDVAFEIVLFLAKKRTYHPVREYLERVATYHPVQDLSILDSIATRYFGSVEPLHNVFMRKTLIALVKRIFEPGCQLDTATILQGKQGVQKSTFWRALVKNADWFDDTIASGGSDKDERLKLRRFWIMELAELEAVFRRKEIASLRGFLTTKSDNIRVPYGRSIESFPRTSGFVGSVNPCEFLVDPEGHRRYWIIPVLVDRIPVEKLVHELDQLWAAAVHAYRLDEQHWLTPDEEKRNALLNKRFEVGDSWQENIELYLETTSETTITDILTNCLRLEFGRHDRSSQMRVAEALKRLGWVKGEKKKVNGKSTPVWRCQPENMGYQPGVNQVSTEVSTTSNLDRVSFSDNKLTPLPQNSSNFQEKQDLYIDPKSTEENSLTGVNLQKDWDKNDETEQHQAVEEVDTSVDTSDIWVDTLTVTDSSVTIAQADLPIENLGFPLKIGDRVRCYPNTTAADKEWVKNATVTDLQTQIQNGKCWMISATVSYPYKGKQEEKTICGGNVNWILGKA